MADHYQVLGVSKQATPEEIKKAVADYAALDVIKKQWQQIIGS